MDKKNVISSLNSVRKRKPSKKLVDTIRKEAFQNAYPDQKERPVVVEAESLEPTSEKEQKETTAEPEKKEWQKDAVSQEKAAQDEKEVIPVQSEKEGGSVDKPETNKRGRKKKVTEEGPNTFTTLNCTQNTLNRAKISSAISNTPMYQFVDEAIDHYIQYLKESGKITLDI